MKFNTVEHKNCLIISKQGSHSNVKVIISKYPSLDSYNDPSNNLMYFDIYYPSDEKYSSCNLLGYINKHNLQVVLITPKDTFENLLNNRPGIGIGLDILKKYFKILYKINGLALSHTTYKPKDGTYYVDIAKNEYENKAFKSSINNASHALTLNPDDSDLYFLIGEDYYALGEKISAVKMYQEAISYNDVNVQYYLSLSKVLDDLDVYNEGLRNASKAIELDHNNPFGYMLLANIYVHINKTQDAVKAFKSAIHVSNSKYLNAQLFSNIGILEQLHNAKRALNNYKRAASLEPYDSIYIDLMGSAYNTLGDYKHAINEYQQAIYIESDPMYYYDLAIAEQNAGDYNDSLHHIHIAIKLNPKDSEYYNALGNLLNDSLQLPYPAIECYQTAIHLNNSNATYYSGLGRAYNSLDDYERSIEYCEKSLSINPKNADTWNTLSVSRCSESQYDPQLAISEAQQAVKLDNKSSVYYNNLAQVEQNIHHYSLSIQNIKQALKIDPNNPQYRKHLIEVERLLKVNGIPDNNINYTEKLNQLIGLKSVKNRLKTYIHRVQIEKFRTNKHNHGEMHIVFEGNPGTGKTTVAKLLSYILYQRGITTNPKCVEIHATQLVSKDYGVSARKIRRDFKEAMGGVLFIDEAYVLAHHSRNSYAEDEAVNELVPELEKYNDAVVVILAGYPQKMEYFLNHSNPGLSSRFSDVISFPDFSNQECERIIDLYLRQHQYRLASSKAKQLLHKDLNEYIIAKRSDNQHIFANARTVRTIYQRLRDTVSNRLCDTYSKNELKVMGKDKRSTINTITISDIKRTFKPFNLLKYNQNAREALNNLIGLNGVKSVVHTYVNRVIMKELRTGHKNHGEMNFIFEGNPGTGKTTVAKLFGKILFQAGITKSYNFVYVSAAELTGRYRGAGVNRVKKAVHNALNGVLFIDEAYMLANVNYIAAVSELVKDVEQYRNEIVVILAGYRHGMEQLLTDSNAGLNSRFSEKIIFPNYTNKECQQIMLYDLKKDNFTLASNHTEKLLMKKLNKYISFKRHSDFHSFANARTVRNIYKRILNNFSNRILDSRVQSKSFDDLKGTNLINTISSADINKTFDQIHDKLKVRKGTQIGF